MARREWTTTQRKMAISSPPELVARAIGRTRMAVWSYRFRNGLTTKPNYFSPEDDKRIISMRRSNHTWHEIAMAMGRTAGSVQSRAQKIKMAQNGDR